MLTYAQIKSNRRKFLALTGLTPKEFKLVLPAFERAYEAAYPATKTLAGARRQRKTGGGRKSALDTPEQKLLFALVYLKDIRSGSCWARCLHSACFRHRTLGLEIRTLTTELQGV